MMQDVPRDDPDAVRELVRAQYARLAGGSSGCCAPSAGSPGAAPSPALTERLGYDSEDLRAAPAEANLGLGCGNPLGIAALRPGEVVLDLGSGAGLDCFLAARRVGPEGRVIGVDMTAEMVARARANAARHGLEQVDFRQGTIEDLPVDDASVDVILSNCVINLSPDKPAVFREAYRVLKPGGRLAISDVVALAPLPEAIRRHAEAWAGCVAGAATADELRAMLVAAGFTDVRVTVVEASRAVIAEWGPGLGAERYVASAHVEGVRPVGVA